jgi:hypothetical protein
VYSKLDCFVFFVIGLGFGLANVAVAQVQTPAATTAAASPATATATASLHGHIADPTAALIPGAKLSITTSEGKPVTTATADASGAYQVNGLMPGAYIVRVSVDGFAPFASR